ncbi:MAG: hypothetical protein RJA44_1435, partial [Pseudomonadota bacterium]
MTSPIPPAPLPPLDEAEAQAWRLLERRLRQLQGFALLVYFVRTPLLAARLRKRLHAQLQACQRELAIVASVHPENFAELSLKALFGRTGNSAPIGAHWLEAFRGAGQPAWDTERRELLARLNERRSRLEAEFQAPLILLLPAGAEAEMADLAPDLWHIRLPSAELSAAPAGGDASMAAEARLIRPSDPARSAEPPVSDALRYWFEQWHANFDDLNAADIRPDHPNLEAISLWDGARALDACLSYGRLDQAALVANELLAVSRARVDAALPEHRDVRLRDVAVSLNNVGQVARAQGDWAGAEKVYRESLAIRRELVERLGGTPEALRDVSVSLDNVGRAAWAQGDWAGAEQVYRESLAISRELVERLGGTPEALRDVSIVLDNVGRVARAQGDWAGAEQVYRESLAISRDLVERLGGTPEALRDVSVSLNNVGRVAEAQGDWAGAEQVYRESLAIRRELVDRLGGTPEALRDVSVSLDNVGRVAEAQGDWAEAEQAYRESLAIRRRLAERLGGTPEALDDLAIALMHNAA